jgi:two-component system chemotaxis response regulator CheB
LIVVLHMPAGFTASYAQTLDTVCAMRVKEAADGETLGSGCAYIAPGGRHLLLEKKRGGFFLKLDDSPYVNRHRPSVDKTFFSAASCSSPNSMGIILTGMGDDGARGLKEMHERGCVTVAQDQESCLVFGMPRRAIAMGAATMVLPLQEIPQAILRFIQAGN